MDQKPDVRLVRFLNMTTDEQLVLRDTSPEEFTELRQLANAATAEIRSEFWACLQAMCAKEDNDKVG